MKAYTVYSQTHPWRIIGTVTADNGKEAIAKARDLFPQAGLHPLVHNEDDLIEARRLEAEQSLAILRRDRYGTFGSKV